MPNYNENDISGTEWQRCFSVNINNTYSKIPEITFQEEKIYNLNVGRINNPIGYCTKQYNATESFPILDLDTNQETGQTMTHAFLYQALYSLYIKTAKERDNIA